MIFYYVFIFIHENYLKCIRFDIKYDVSSDKFNLRNSFELFKDTQLVKHKINVLTLKQINNFIYITAVSKMF